MREPSWSFVPTAKWGLSRVDPCHHRVLSAPPPPRLVGLYVIRLCACATPAEASIWAAMGAVRPSAIMVWTNSRRPRTPAFTWPIMCRSSRSSINGPPQGGSAPTGWMASYKSSMRKLSREPPGSGLCLLEPVGQPPEGGIPPGEVHAVQGVGRARDPVAPQDRDHHHVGDHDVVHLDEQGGTLHRIELAVRRLVGAVVLVVAEAGDVAALPLVGLLRGLPGAELVHEVLRVGRGHGRVVHLQIR